VLAVVTFGSFEYFEFGVYDWPMSASKKSAVAARPAANKVGGRFVLSAATERAATQVLSRKAKALGKSTKKGVGKKVAGLPKRATSTGMFLPLKLAYSFDIDPLVDAVQRHVNLKPRIADELREDFRQMFEQSVRQLGRPRRAQSKEAADPVLTTQEAADLAGVSRPFMVARIDAGDIPLHQQVGNQRRVLRSSVLKWQERERGKRRAALKRLGQSLDEEMSSY
jgi:excisionase family DNA binding protein